MGRDIVPTLRAETHGHQPCIVSCVGVDLHNLVETGDIAATITSRVGIPDATGARVIVGVSKKENATPEGGQRCTKATQQIAGLEGR